MNYLRWFQQYMLAKTSSWVARHPIETAIGFTALYYERKLTLELIATFGLEMTSFLTGWRPALRIGGQTYAYKGVIRGTGSALARRFPERAAQATKVRNLGAAARTRSLALLASPAGAPAAVAIGYSTLAATAITLSRDEDPLTEQVQQRGVSQGMGGTNQPSLGSWTPF